MTQKIPNRSECFIDYNGQHRLMDDQEWNMYIQHFAEYEASARQMLIAQRNAALASSDWVVQRSTETGQPIPEEWKIYRQALRDLTSQPNFPNDVVWPDAPKAKQ